MCCVVYRHKYYPFFRYEIVGSKVLHRVRLTRQLKDSACAVSENRDRPIDVTVSSSCWWNDFNLVPLARHVLSGFRVE